MKTSDSIAKLAPALVAASAAMPVILKDRTNPHFKSTYATLDQILETVRPILATHGLAVLQGASTPHSDDHGRITGFTVETMLVHQSGEYISNTAVMPVGKADPQGAGAALTYGRRYSLAALLSLATEEDDDGHSAMPTPQQQARQFAQQAQRQQATGPMAEAVQGVVQQMQRQARPSGNGRAPVCPTCEGPMWDNREGKRNPKAPDFKCKDKQCDGAIWLPKQEAAAPARRAPAQEPNFDDYPPALQNEDDDLPF